MKQNNQIFVYNAGTPGGTTITEFDLIKNRLLPLKPDLIIMYDGWNDFARVSDIEKSIQNWNNVCQLGTNSGFDTVIAIQPLPGSSQRVLTNQEVENSCFWNTNYKFSNNTFHPYSFNINTRSNSPYV